MAQRYRAILHLVNPIIEAGHDLTIVVSKDYVNLEKSRHNPTNAGKSAPNTVEYIRDCFGIKADLSKVNFTKDKKVKCDLNLCYDNQNKKALGIPYNTANCYVKGKAVYVGNPMCDEIENAKSIIRGTALIVHPGGGRGYVSPQKKHMSKERVTKNNIKFLQKVLDNLPVGIQTVTIKTHPVPYQRCTKKALEKFVIPHLKFSGKITVANMDTISLLATREYILNFGGTTGLWMVNSGRKAINIKGMDYCGASREKRIDERGGGVPMEKLSSHEWPPAQAGTQGKSIENIMEVINESIN